jgi:tellurite resistance protein TerC
VDVAPWVWGLTIAGIIAIITLDLLLADRKPHRISTKEASIWVGVYVSLAVVFGIGIGLISGWEYGGQFFAGYITELSLSVDNLFVFVVILSSFAVPAQYQHKVLLYGIIIALILRAVLIALGAAAIERFSWVFYVFGALLLVTAVNLMRHRDDTPEPGKNKVLRWAERVIPSTPEYQGTKLFARVDAKRVVTPMFFVMVAIGTTDILFALDSIPAIFGLTQEAFIVLTANAFALFGLRQMYFLIHGLLDRLVYLSIGLAVILGFIGVKLVLHAIHETTELKVPEVSLAFSLTFILLTLVVTTLASIWKVRRDPESVHHVGMAADAEHDAERLAGDELGRLSKGEAPAADPAT